MLRLFLWLAFVGGAFILVGCSEDDCIGSDQDIDEYIISNSADLQNLIETEQGVYYIIDEPGDTTSRPTLSSAITVNYVGTTTERDTFDQTSGTPVTFILDELIEGWRIGIPQIGAGGSIRLFVPANRGYGANQAANLCANSALIFDIDLISFQ
ncbi:FKBP-type peptidyl-prolyl isomerase-like protein [Neolewinella xylanilytica]|uniref:Peptidyl-prolyl cis-trans isomerase n=2 Tax=Neolewinella xylanilytica TaxID=1514080 RepID=A0A2S6I3S8_9BACT|nr:FKBP-type peptidyl-prolyl isomerase-like protein [Neolewinella xylanilytica]